ncbi:hypothetical protein LINPERPRIM_LOCUS26760 [Linum perenne]
MDDDHHNTEPKLTNNNVERTIIVAIPILDDNTITQHRQEEQQEQQAAAAAAAPEPRKTELSACDINCRIFSESIFVLSIIILPVFLILLTHSAHLELPPLEVVSAYVSRFNATGSHLTATWHITLRLHLIFYNEAEMYRVEAYVFHSARPSHLASTRRVWVPDDNLIHRHGDTPLVIQLKAEDAVVGDDVVDAISRDVDRFGSFRFRVLILVWARVVPSWPKVFSEKYYFVRVSCDPDWVGPSEFVSLKIWPFSLKKKCKTHMIDQSKLNEKWTSLNMTS